MSRAICAAAILLVPPIGGMEAQSGRSTPEQVVRDFFKAEEEGRWIDAAHLLDLKRFEPIRRAAVTSLRSIASRRSTTAKELMQMDPAMPLAVAEYQVRTMNEGFRSLDFLSREFARVSSADSLASLPVDEAAARWLEARGWKWQNEMALREMRRRPTINCPQVPDSIIVGMSARFRTTLSAILGATDGSDSVRYVVVGLSHAAFPRNDPSGDETDPISPKAVTLRKLDGNWRIAPIEDMPHSDAFGGATFAIGCGVEPNPESKVPKK